LLAFYRLARPANQGPPFHRDGDIARLDDAAITRLRGHSIGFVFQYHYLISAFTALENVMMPLLVDKTFPSQDMDDCAAALLDEVVGLAREK
jgi:lipoprotein-releasing system ATP-binding protein